MLHPVSITIGADPEFFFEKGGVIIGSEHIVAEDGFKPNFFSQAKIVRDGIQAELNLPACATLQGFGQEIHHLMLGLKNELQDLPSVKPCWRGLIQMTSRELDTLSESSRQLGCNPSYNVYGERPITANPKTYMKRSAGGHLHFGIRDRLPRILSNYENEVGRCVPILDIFVGNLAVLMDCDPGQAERRENYGRAGEYRMPPHGLEYRTLSNFWLRSFPLMDFVFGMANFAISVVNHSIETQDIEQELIDTVDLESVIHAINTNNWDEAYKNYETIKPFLRKYSTPAFPLDSANLVAFETFVRTVRHEGLIEFFPEDPMNYWARSGNREPFRQLVTTHKQMPYIY